MATFPATPGTAWPGRITPGDPGAVPAPPPPVAAGDLRAELLLSAGWADISAYAYHGDGTTGLPVITRGRADETTTAAPGSATLTLNNRDGRFTAYNPTGPWYGLIGRNTPLRLSVPDTASYLRLEDDAVSYASCPDRAALDITGDTEIQIDLRPSGYVSCTLASKWAATGNQRSWWLGTNADGTVSFAWTPDGSTISKATSAYPLPQPLGRIAIKVTLAAATGTVTFWTAPQIGGTWSQLGPAQVLGATSVFNSTAPVQAGYNADRAQSTPVALGVFGAAPGVAWAPGAWAGLTGKVYEFQLRNGIGGAIKADAVFTAQAEGAHSFSDGYGNTWTMQGTAAISARRFRFHGEVPEWAPRWDPSGTDVYTAVTGAGLLRRLQQGTPPVFSAMTRGWQRATGALAPVAYWPCEDGAIGGGTTTVTQLASGLPGGAPMVFSRSVPQLASSSVFACSKPIPGINGSSWWGTVAPYTVPASPAVIARFLWSVPSGGDTDQGAVFRFHTTGTCYRVDLRYQAASSGSIVLLAYDTSQNTLISSTPIATGLNGLSVYVSIELTTSGTAIAWRVNVMQPAATAPAGLSGTLASASVGACTDVAVNPRVDALLSGSAVGQISVQSTFEPLTDGPIAGPLNAWAGETAGLRFARLCAEQGYACRVYGYPAASVAMGQQGPDTIMNLLQECESADRGMIFEPRDGLALGYRTSASMTAQSPTPAAYTSGMLGDGGATPLQPADDDQLTANDVIVTRGAAAWAGSSAQATVTSGPLSTQAPPSGAGDYQVALTQNLYSDFMLPSAAGWLAHLGTVNELRYPGVPVDLTGTQNTAQALADLDLGGYLQLTGPPGWMPPDPAKMIVWGVTETIGGPIWWALLQTTPESPYETLVAGSGAVTDSRADSTGSTGSTLAGGYSATATSLSVTGISVPMWTTAAGDFPFDIIVAGERMTVTNITGTSPQTFTVIRAVNGVAKAQAFGAAVNVFAPACLALA